MTHEEILDHWFHVVYSRSLAAAITMCIEAGIPEQAAAQPLVKIWDQSWLDGTLKSEPWIARASEMVAAHRWRQDRATRMLQGLQPQEAR